jgi:uncharacterized protein YjgD (DUF1641 family)
MGAREEEMALADEAIEALVKTAVKLKESGLLDMLETIAEKYEELLLYTSSDKRVYHALAMLEAALNGLKEADPWRYKPAVERLTACIASALDANELEKVKPVKGVLGLVRALSDPRVAKGLGLLLHLAAKLGECIESKSASGGH